MDLRVFSILLVKNSEVISYTVIDSVPAVSWELPLNSNPSSRRESPAHASGDHQESTCLGGQKPEELKYIYTFPVV